MKRAAVWLAAMVLLLVLLPVRAKASESTPLADFAHTLDPQTQTVVLGKYVGSSPSVVIPGSYTVEGVSYQVVLDPTGTFRENTGLTSVVLEAGVEFRENSMRGLFAGCAQLVSVDLAAVDTAQVTDMSYLFYRCRALQRLELASLKTGNVTCIDGMFSGCSNLSELRGYETWDTGSLESMYQTFNEVEKLAEIDLSRWDLDQVKNTGWCFQFCRASKILLPDNLAVISAGFLNHASRYAGSTFTVPAGVRQIGYGHTLYDFATNDFVAFQVAEGNTSYVAVDGILYSADGTQMLAIPRNKTFADHTYEIPEGVTFLGELSFSRNYNIHTLVLPNSYEIYYVPVNDPAYILYEDMGNLNAGTNLSIAIYCYTGITDYAVKADNPRYTSIEGILYSKDMTAVVAIPSRYDQKIAIPEGVAVWNSEAMWAVDESVPDGLMANCPGVSIPASLTQIAQDQIDKLNRLQARFPGFQITVASENPLYRTDETGKLVTKVPIKNAEITLDQEVFVYDGAEKNPIPTVTLDGTVLAPGIDYQVTYIENVNAGTATVQLTGAGIYGGTAQVSFTIAKAPAPAYTAPEPLTAVYGQTLGELTLPQGFCWSDTDMAVENVGERTFLASYSNGDPNYETAEGIPVTVIVMPKQVTADFSGVMESYSYTAEAIMPAVSVKDGEREIPANEYILEYTDNTGPGTAVVTVKDADGGNYTVTGGSKTFIIQRKQLPEVVWLEVLTVITAAVVFLNSKRRK